MSHLLARIMLALLMVPLASIVYMMQFMWLVDQVLPRRHQLCLFLSGVTATVFVAIYWTMLWRRSVRWSRNRVGLTLGGTTAALAVGALFGVIGAEFDRDFGAFIWAPATVFLWMTCTVLVWRETAAERRERLRTHDGPGLACPRCGYNMTGLRRTICPECGASFTIEELLAEQQVGQELEEAAATPADW